MVGYVIDTVSKRYPRTGDRSITEVLDGRVDAADTIGATDTTDADPAE